MEGSFEGGKVDLTTGDTKRFPKKLMIADDREAREEMGSGRLESILGAHTFDHHRAGGQFLDTFQLGELIGGELGEPTGAELLNGHGGVLLPAKLPRDTGPQLRIIKAAALPGDGVDLVVTFRKNIDHRAGYPSDFEAVESCLREVSKRMESSGEPVAVNGCQISGETVDLECLEGFPATFLLIISGIEGQAVGVKLWVVFPRDKMGEVGADYVTGEAVGVGPIKPTRTVARRSVSTRVSATASS